MTNDESKKSYYFSVKSNLELYSSEWLKNKKAAMVNGDTCFQNALNDASNYQNIKKDPKIISNIKPFINQYNWEGIDFQLHQKDCKKFAENHKLISLNILYVQHNTKQIRTGYKSKCNHRRKNQVNLLMITDGKKWNYLALRSLQALFRGMSSNHNGEFYCLNCCHSYRTENRLKKHEKVFKNHDYCYVEMPKEHNKILKDRHGEKSLKAPFIIEFDKKKG